MPGAHFSVKHNLGRMVARVIHSSKLVSNDLFFVREMVQFLCTKLDIETKQGREEREEREERGGEEREIEEIEEMERERRDRER